MEQLQHLNSKIRLKTTKDKIMKIAAQTGRVICGFVEILARENKGIFKIGNFINFYDEAQLVKKTNYTFGMVDREGPALFEYNVTEMGVKRKERVEAFMSETRMALLKQMPFIRDYLNAFPLKAKVIMICRKNKGGLGGSNYELNYAFEGIDGNILISSVAKMVFDYYERLPIKWILKS